MWISYVCVIVISGLCMTCVDRYGIVCDLRWGVLRAIAKENLFLYGKRKEAEAKAREAAAKAKAEEEEMLLGLGSYGD